MSHSDSNFYKPFALVLGALVIFTIFIGIVANSWSPDSGPDPLVMAQQKKALQPVGKSRVTGQSPASVASDDAMPKANEAVTATVETTQSDVAETASVNVDQNSAPAGAASMKVKATVQTNCAGCHNAGLNGAAKTDDAQAWTVLADKGIDQLTASVINGKGAMPARAESSLNDGELRQAVELMISAATGDNTTTAAAGAATAVAATAAAGSAEATATVPDDVKKVVDTACAACHIAGVADAPKFGDKAAWSKRMEKGLDALTASAIAGVGGMPARGASTLDDEQMKLAIEYMLSK